jgi:hypothetical protein
MGDGINLGSRLEGANKYWKTQILASGETVAKVAGRIPMRRVDRIRVSGKTQAVDVYTPVEIDDRADRNDRVRRSRRISRGIGIRRRGCMQMLEGNPEDGVAKRCWRGLRLGGRSREVGEEDSFALDKL